MGYVSSSSDWPDNLPLTQSKRARTPRTLRDRDTGKLRSGQAHVNASRFGLNLTGIPL
ncbi:MAG: hypothetical protein OXS32_05825 [Verrucomicrobiales bacterium]|nr:hypothetical protein [Verrucomicrobiales bacterium]